MNIDQWIVTAAGASLIAFIYWFFFMKRQRAVRGGSNVEILVDGGYTPEVISVPVGQEVNITFYRKDPSSCLEEVNIPDFGIRKFLPLNERTTVTLLPREKKPYVYSCGMNMFHGTVIAE